MGLKRQAIVDYANNYWWRPCQDGIVWVKSDRITISAVAARLKLTGYDGAFLWYPGKRMPRTEGLYLLPRSKINPNLADKWAADFPDARMICSYEDGPADEPPEIRSMKLPYYGLNDCTHFTTECLGAGGFQVTDEHARRGAPDLYRYLVAHKDTKVLASDISETEAAKVISAGLLEAGDVIVYGEGAPVSHHHAVVYLGDGVHIAMHTWHSLPKWQDAGGDGQTYSLFHLSGDDDFASAAGRWTGWWQITQGGEVRYYYLSANGHVFSQKGTPTSTKDTPKGPDYWFPDADNPNIVRVCVRGRGIVETYARSAGAPSDAQLNGTRQNGTGGSIVRALKLQ